MGKMLWALAGLIVVVLVGLGGVLAFDAPAKPAVLASVSDPFAAVDFRDLPAVQTYAARDGTQLGCRAYQGSGAQVVVLIHGSSDDGSGMHPLAKALRDAGASVYVPVLRGHRGSGRSGDIDYIGQLEDDLADFGTVLRPLHPGAGFTLIGFSSGGGFVLRVIAGRDELGQSLAHIEEVATALGGQYRAALRIRKPDKPPPPIYSISRGVGVHVFSAMPVVVNNHVAGVIYTSRTPSNIFDHLYQEPRNTRRDGS